MRRRRGTKDEVQTGSDRAEIAGLNPRLDCVVTAPAGTGRGGQLREARGGAAQAGRGGHVPRQKEEGGKSAASAAA